MSSSISIRCQCGKSILVGQEVIGRRIKCRSCGHTMEVRQRTRRHAQTGWASWIDTTQITRISTALTRKLRTRCMSAIHSIRRFILVERIAATTLPLRPKIVFWLSYGYLVCALLAWMLLWRSGDAWWPGTLLLFIGRWILLTPLILLIPAALIYRTRAMVPLSLATVIVLGPIMGFRTGWRRLLPPQGGTPIRVVTFNAEVGDALATRLDAQLQEWSADIIAIQECGPLLREAIGHVIGWNSHEENGVCLLTRYPIKDAAVMDRRTFAYIREFDSNDIGGSADVVRYTLVAPGGTIDVTTVHLETPRKGLEDLLSGDVSSASLRRLELNTELRDIESRAARAWSERGRHPMLILGDFNMPVESRIFQRHWGDLTDAFSEVGFGFGMTKDNGWIRVRIDHVLYGSGWHAKRVVVGNNVGSDHRPVLVDLVLAR